jgi:hypothetical protein
MGVLYFGRLLSLLFGVEFMKVWVESRGRMIEQRRRAA